MHLIPATKNRVRGMLLKSGKQFSLDSHIDIENTTVVGSRAHQNNDDDDDQERVAQLSRRLGMKCAWIAKYPVTLLRQSRYVFELH